MGTASRCSLSAANPIGGAVDLDAFIDYIEGLTQPFAPPALRHVTRWVNRIGAPPRGVALSGAALRHHYPPGTQRLLSQEAAPFVFEDQLRAEDIDYLQSAMNWALDAGRAGSRSSMEIAHLEAPLDRAGSPPFSR